MRRPPQDSRSRVFRARATACALTLASGMLLAAPAGAQDGVAPPARGTAVATTFALLSYSRELCDGIAGKLVVHWGKLGSSLESQLETMRQRVVDRDLSSLASARAASDLVVKNFLPRVREETDSKTGDALERLHGLGVELCDTIAYPSGTRETFQDNLAAILDRIEREEAELGRVLVVGEDALEDAMEPYLEHVQMAGVEAEGEYRDYLDSLKPPPEQPTLQDRMEAWHRGYSRVVLPTKQALGKYLHGRRANDPTAIRTSCRELLAAVIPLLRNERLFKAPLPAINKPLNRAFTELKQMASECTAGRSREMEVHYRQMQVQLAAAAGLLAEFSLKP